jgi:hypothetical protein
MTIQAVIDRVAKLLRDSAKNYWTNQLLYDSTKEIVYEIARQTRALRKSVAIAVVAGQADYRLPSDLLAIEMATYNDGEGGYPLQRADLKSIAFSERYTPGRLTRWYDFPEDARIMRASGTATGGSNTTLINTGVDFTTLAGERVIAKGDRVLNLTDGSEGKVGTIAATTITIKGTTTAVAGLSGGADNLFAAGDSYRIDSYHTIHEAIRLHGTPDATDAVGTKSLQIVYQSGHFDIDVAVADQGINTATGPVTVEIELDTEYNEAVFEGVQWKALAYRHGANSVEAQSQYAIYIRKRREATPLAKTRSDEMMDSWSRGSYNSGVEWILKEDGSIPTGL